jgi:hypothetical protein
MPPSAPDPGQADTYQPQHPGRRIIAEGARAIEDAAKKRRDPGEPAIVDERYVRTDLAEAQVVETPGVRS